MICEMVWRLKKIKPKICRSCWQWKRCMPALEKFTMSKKKPQKNKTKREWKKHVPKRKGQQHLHLTGITKQRTPENKGCVPGGSTSSLTSWAFKARQRQIYKTCEEKSKTAIVVYIICISLLQISGELTCNYSKNKIIQARSFPAATQAAVPTCQLYFLQCGHNFFTDK